jgi:hypothetical protein
MEVPAVTWAIAVAGPLLVIGVAVYYSVKKNMADLKANWTKYRCYPIYLPFAEMIEPTTSTADNFAYCMTMFAQVMFDAILDPIYSLFDVIVDTVTNLQGSTNVFRTILTKLMTVILSVVGDVFGKITNGMTILLKDLNKIRDIQKRAVGSAWYGAFMGTTIVDAIMSGMNFMISLIQAIILIIFAISIILLFTGQFWILIAVIPLAALIGLTYCFDPDTPVTLRDGRVVPMKDVQIGDTLQDGSVVEGVMTFLNRPDVQLYELNGVTVSGKHKVFHDKWIYVSDHPDAKPSSKKLDRLTCLITNTNEIVLNQTRFSDFEEVSDQATLQEIEKITWGRVVHEDYNVGFSPDTLVFRNNEFVPMKDLQIGDVIAGGGKVEGLVWLDGEDMDWVEFNGLLMSGTQPVVTGFDAILARRALGATYQRNKPPKAMSIIVGNATGWFKIYNAKGKPYLVRDYLDSHDVKKLERIEELVLRQKNA